MGGCVGRPARERKTGSPEEQPLSAGSTHFPSEQQPHETMRWQQTARVGSSTQFDSLEEKVLPLPPETGGQS